MICTALGTCPALLCVLVWGYHLMTTRKLVWIEAALAGYHLMTTRKLVWIEAALALLCVLALVLVWGCHRRLNRARREPIASDATRRGARLRLVPPPMPEQQNDDSRADDEHVPGNRGE